MDETEYNEEAFIESIRKILEDDKSQGENVLERYQDKVISEVKKKRN